jgi:hypothetical protein
MPDRNPTRLIKFRIYGRLIVLSNGGFDGFSFSNCLLTQTVVYCMSDFLCTVVSSGVCKTKTLVISKIRPI